MHKEPYLSRTLHITYQRASKAHVLLTSTHLSFILCLIISRLLFEQGNRKAQGGTNFASLKWRRPLQWHLKKHSSGQSSAEVSNFQQIWCLTLIPCDAESTRALFCLFLVVGTTLFQPAVLWGGCTLVMSLLCGGTDKGIQEVEWSDVVSILGCLISAGYSTAWSTVGINGSVRLLVSIPTRVTAADIYSGGDLFSGLGRPGRWSSQTKALVAFWKIHLSVSLLKTRGNKHNKILPYWSCSAMSQLLPDRRWASIPLFAAVIWLITSICSRRAASYSLSAVWVLSVSSREVGSDGKHCPSGLGGGILPVPSCSWVAGPKIKSAYSVRSWTLKSQGWVDRLFWGWHAGAHIFPAWRGCPCHHMPLGCVGWGDRPCGDKEVDSAAQWSNWSLHAN